MDRKELLANLIRDRFGGVQKAFADAIGKSPSQVGQWLSGHRTFGDASARHVELILGLGQGYFGYDVDAKRRQMLIESSQFNGIPKATPTAEETDLDTQFQFDEFQRKNTDWMKWLEDNRDAIAAIAKLDSSKRIRSNTDEARRFNLAILLLAHYQNDVRLLADAVGCPYTHIEELLNGKTPFHRGHASDFEVHLQDKVPFGSMDDGPDWGRVGNIFLNIDGRLKAIPPPTTYVPDSRVLFKLSAGVTGYQVEPLEGNGPPIFFRRDWIDQRHFRADKLLAVKVSGASMEPGLYDGDLVVLNSLDTTPADGEVFAVNYEGELVIKRLRRDSGEWWLTSDNLDKRRYADKRCDENALLIGRVIYKQSERI